MWINNVALTLYLDKAPRLERKEYNRDDGTVRVQYRLSFYGRNALSGARKRRLRVGIYVVYKTPNIPFQYAQLAQVPAQVHVQGSILTYRRTPEHDKLTFIDAHRLKVMPTGNHDPEIYQVRKSTFIHLADFAEQHGYQPPQHTPVNQGGARNPLAHLDEKRFSKYLVKPDTQFLEEELHPLDPDSHDP